MDEVISRLKKNPRFREVGAIIFFIGIVNGVARDGSELSKIWMAP